MDQQEHTHQMHDSASHAPQYGRANPWMVSTLLLAGVIVGFGFSKIPYFNAASDQAKVAAIDTAAASNPQDEKKAAAADKKGEKAKSLTEEQIGKLPDDDAVKGSASAPITLVEFSDFQCPYCGKFWKDTLPQIEENYVKTGKVKLVYRDFPLPFHPQAQPAALASECAHEQGKFWEMHDAIFENQKEWAGQEGAGDFFKAYGKKIGLNGKQFDECMKSKKYASEVMKDVVDGSAVGVGGTPGFFVNGKAISGALPYENFFKPIFDAELAGKKWELIEDAAGYPSVKVEE